MGRVLPSTVRQVIDEMYPGKDWNKDDQCAFVLSFGVAGPVVAPIVALVEQVPPELLVMPPEKYAQFVASLATLRGTVEMWKTHGSTIKLKQVSGFGSTNPIALLRRALESCPDEPVAAQAKRLTFIADKDLQEALAADMSAIDRALSNAEWKAATVLGGSFVEALLLWALNQQPIALVQAKAKALVKEKTLHRQPDTNIEKWDLHQYITVATKMQLTAPETLQQCDLLRGFRNLIHPGRAQRLRQKCDRGTAFAAVAAIEAILRDLTP